jgi:hypothetical protein
MSLEQKNYAAVQKQNVPALFVYVNKERGNRTTLWKDQSLICDVNCAFKFDKCHSPENIVFVLMRAFSRRNNEICLGSSDATLLL